MPEASLQTGSYLTADEIDNILNPLRAGIVPRTGFEHFCVGRSMEVTAVLDDVRRAARGQSAVRFLVGPYGAGKSFTMALARSAARSANMATATADLSPDRRFYGGHGVARALYSELVRTLETNDSSEGEGLRAILDGVLKQAREAAERQPGDLEVLLETQLRTLHKLSLGHLFADVVARYCQARLTGDAAAAAQCVRWLRGEYTTKTQAYAELKVRGLIDDGNCWDALKALAAVARLAGLHGVMVCVDELVNLQKLPLRRAREANLEQILKIINDGLQGTTAGLVVYFGATPQALEDTRTGLFSYEALRGRLAPSRVARHEAVAGGSGPVLHLAPLTPEEGFVLLQRLRHVHAGGDERKHLLPDEALRVFLEQVYAVMGAAAYQTPRDLVIQFVSLLDALQASSELDWRTLISHAVGNFAAATDATELDDLDLEVSS